MPSLLIKGMLFLFDLYSFYVSTCEYKNSHQIQSFYERMDPFYVICPIDRGGQL